MRVIGLAVVLALNLILVPVPGGGAAAGGRGWGCRERRFRQLGLYTAYAL
jgi:hypothetical protein